MNLAQIKASNISKRRLFQIERAIVREITDLWFKEKSYFNDDFAENVEVDFKESRVEVSFSNKVPMKHGSPEATVNEMMKGLILTMATDQATGKLLKTHKTVIVNVLDVFVHRLKEIADRKFIFQRLQSLELGFGIAFGLNKGFYHIKHAQQLLEDVLTIASLSSADETIETLVHAMLEAQSLASEKQGVTFHILMEGKNEAGFISLPFGMEQTSYVSLLGSHTLRCNILAELDMHNNVKSGILKIDAPSNPLNFIRHKGLDLPIEEKVLMPKLCSSENLLKKDFSANELSFLKLLFNEYSQLADFLLSTKRISAGLRLLLIFPRVNIFKILHEENPAIPVKEPQTLEELACLHSQVFAIQSPHRKRKRKKFPRIPEKVIQKKIFESISALARHSLKSLYKPLTDIKRALTFYTLKGYSDPDNLNKIRQRIKDISAYLNKLNRVQMVVLEANGKDMDLAASMAADSKKKLSDALEEIIRNIQVSEVENSKEVVLSKMLDYLSFVTVRLEQLERVSSTFIKQEVVKEIESHTVSILVQAKSYYRLIMDKPAKRRR